MLSMKRVASCSATPATLLQVQERSPELCPPSATVAGNVNRIACSWVSRGWRWSVKSCQELLCAFACAVTLARPCNHTIARGFPTELAMDAFPKRISNDGLTFSIKKTALVANWKWTQAIERFWCLVSS